MPQTFRYKLVHRLVFAAIGGAAMLLADSGAALAGYGPPPPPTPVPGGYYCVVTSQTIGVAGKVIGPLGLGRLAATLNIRPGTLAAPLQITVTQPYGPASACSSGAGIGGAGFLGYHDVGGIGILVQHGGSNFGGNFRRPIIVHLSSSSITRSSLIVVWDGKRFVGARATVSQGSAIVELQRASDVAVLVPDRHPRG
jgi:hypothetical protein